MTGLDAYGRFLQAKVKLAPALGFEVAPAEINPALKDFVRTIVGWAAAGGRRGIFSRFGLHKTSTQIELARLARTKRAVVPLIVLPLGVRYEFMDEVAARFTAACAVDLRFIRSTAGGVAELGSDDADPPVYLTNYESVREGKIDASRFGFVSLDEAAVLRGFGGTKTFREFMARFPDVPYRFVATATPSPNEYIELLAYAAFLDVMDVGQAKTRFFRRDSENADKLTLHPHKEREFWLWVASWALFVQQPSDLGFSDDGYALPRIDLRWHEVASDHAKAGEERTGQGRMFRSAAAGVTDAAREKRDSLDQRLRRLEAILTEGRGGGEDSAAQETGSRTGEAARPEQGALPSEQGRLPEEGGGLEAGQSGALPRTAAEAHGGDSGPKADAAPGLVPEQPGERARARAGEEAGEVWPDRGELSGDADKPGRALRDLPEPAAIESTALHRPLSPDGAGSGLALPEVQRGDRPADARPGDDRPRDRVSDQFIVWCDLNAEQRGIERTLSRAGISASSLDGAQDIDTRERLLRAWKNRQTLGFVSKPSMYGAGINMQQCHRMIFLGIGHKFHDFIQSIHRCLRYGQTRDVEVHLIYTEAERDIRRALETKWARHNAMVATMAQIIREHGLSQAAMGAYLQRSIGVARTDEVGQGDPPGWRAVHADCVEATAAMAANSVDLIVTSIPFSTQYEYSPSYNDFGHTDDDAHFWAQMDFLIPELHRVLKPGRVAAIHVKDRIMPAGLSGLGFQVVSPFSDDCVAAFRRHGFGFLARKTVVTDVVRENNQTYRLGWSEQCKDGTRMGCGLPEYVLLFRKAPTDRSNGYADVPVVKEKPLCADAGEARPFDKRTNWRKPVPGTGYSRGRWQLDAHGFARSSGDRLLGAEELAALPHDALYKLWRARSLGSVYDFAGHLAVTEDLDQAERLPATFMLLPPHSWHPDVWTDVARMRTLNGAQAAAGREMHLCPLQFDIVDRLIVQFSMPGELVFDPFAGLMTVPLRALQVGRRGLGIELNGGYFRDGVAYLRAAEKQLGAPTLFDLLAAEEGASPAAEVPEEIAAEAAE